MLDVLGPCLPALLAASAVQLGATLSPGPAVVLLLGVGADHGRRVALTVTAGIALGSGILALGTAFGLGPLLDRMAWSGTVLRYLGTGYLASLAAVSVGPAQVAPFWVHLLFGLSAAILGAIHGTCALMLSGRLVRQAYHSARRWIEGLLGIFPAFVALRIVMERK